MDKADSEPKVTTKEEFIKMVEVFIADAGKMRREDLDEAWKKINAIYSSGKDLCGPNVLFMMDKGNSAHNHAGNLLKN